MTATRLTLEAVAHIAVAAGLVATGWQLSLANDHRRVDATLGFQRALGQEPLAGMQRELTERWLEFRETVSVMRSGAISAPNIAAFTREVVYGRAGETQQMDLTPAVIGIVRNLDQMAVCVGAGLCDCDLAFKHFSEYAAEVHSAYDPIIQDVKATFGESTLGQDLEHFVEASTCEELLHYY